MPLPSSNDAAAFSLVMNAGMLGVAYFDGATGVSGFVGSGTGTIAPVCAVFRIALTRSIISPVMNAHTTEPGQTLWPSPQNSRCPYIMVRPSLGLMGNRSQGILWYCARAAVHCVRVRLHASEIGVW